MSISSKVTSLLIVLFVVVAGTQWATQKWVVSPSFEEIEQQYLEQSFEQIVNRLEVEVERLSTISYDWSDWVDTYEFIAGNDPNYPDRNLSEESFTPFDIRYFALVDSSLNIVWDMQFERDGGYPAALDSAPDAQHFLNLIEKNKPTLDLAIDQDQRVVDGIGWAKELYLYSLRPVFNEGEPLQTNGYLIMVRFMDKHALNSISQELMLPIELHPLVATPYSRATILSRTKARIQGTKLITLSDGTELWASTQKENKITQAGRASSNLALSVLISSGLIAFLIFQILIQRLFFRPLKKLTNHVNGIVDSGDYSRRTHVDRGDEIGCLGRSFDTVMGVVDRERNRLEEANHALSERQTQLETIQFELENANRSLEELALTDSLTGLANRRSLELRLEQNWGMLERANQELSLIMVDVDYFKRFNDRHGHQKGDECLQRVADILASVCRRSIDLAARFGGEEFILVLPGVSSAGACEIAMRIQIAMEKLGMPHGESAVHSNVTVSMGIACCIPKQDEHIESLIKSADQALYKAKQNGRNQFKVYDSWTSIQKLQNS